MNDTEEVRVIIIKETEKAFQFKKKDSELIEWFPKSQVSFARRNVKTGEATAEIPEWLLEAKGW